MTKYQIAVSWIMFCLLGLLGWTSVSAQDALIPVLAISTVPPLEPPPSPEEFVQRAVQVLQLTHDVGVNGNATTESWSKLEPSPSQYVLDDMVNDIDYRTTTYNQIFEIGIQVLNTTTKETPADLLDVPFDSPQMMERFHALVDALLPHLNQNVYYLSVGNEVDVYLGNHPDEWATYTAFYTDAVAYIHRIAPWIKVGVTVTFGGAQQYQDEIRALTAASDVAIMTYYPLEGNFDVQSPAAPLTDFPRMLELVGDRPLVLQEVGYPTSTLLGSSDEDQAAFVANVFAAWKESEARIPFLSFFCLGDFSDELTSQLTQYYGLADDHFVAYLRTLGLRQVDGTPKLGWQIFAAEALQWAASHQTG